MAINEWKIWKKLGLVKEEIEPVKIKDDLNAVLNFLKELDVKNLTLQLEKTKDLLRESQVIDENLKDENLKKKITYFDEVLKSYDFFQNDTDINGLRLKKIAQELLRRAKQRNLTDLVKEKKKDMKWR